MIRENDAVTVRFLEFIQSLDHELHHGRAITRHRQSSSLILLH
jgi:hypothetical protein